MHAPMFHMTQAAPTRQLMAPAPNFSQANDFLLNYCAATKGRGHHKASKERTDQIRAVFQDSAPGLLARFERSLGHIGT